MLPGAIRIPMKPTPILLALALAGCLDVADEAGTALSDGALAAPFLAEGTVFLPPTQSDARTQTLLPFPVNATSSTIALDLALGSRYGPAEVPPLATDVLVELRAPDGSVLAEGALSMGEPEAHLEAVANASGEHTLALLSYGGSDEQANGDYVEWRVEVAPRASQVS